MEGGLYVGASAGATLIQGAPKTILGLIPAPGRRITLVEWGVSFQDDTLDPTDGPCLVDLGRTATDGTSGGATEVLLDDDISQAVQTDGRATYLVEPTMEGVLEAVYVHPQRTFRRRYPRGREVKIGSHTTVRVAVPSRNIALAAAWMYWLE